MVLVNVYVPAMHQEYDFSLDQDVKVKTLIKEISEMISHKEQSRLEGEPEELILCDRMEGRILWAEESLAANGIAAGSRLMLI